MGVHPRSPRTKNEIISELRQEVKALKKLVKAHQQVWDNLMQKWVAAVDEYNECRYDCEPVRLAAA